MQAIMDVMNGEKPARYSAMETAKRILAGILPKWKSSLASIKVSSAESAPLLTLKTRGSRNLQLYSPYNALRVQY